uniref:Capsid protein n=1 Tax=Grus japonensis CRESS-DNA-virus sp. TaxID=2815045 RepID=A0A8A4XCH7_9VIRU|nr:MAG: capsid protein [Grus japonensis CRESS-DNA-virus sp.]
MVGKTSGGNKRRKSTATRQAVAKAAKLIRARMAGSPGAPLATRGFGGGYRSMGELKYFDVYTGGVTNVTATTWNFVLLNGIAQGTDNIQRIGKKIMMKSLLFNGNFYNSFGTSLSAPGGCLGRFVIVYDLQANGGALPSGTDVFKLNTVHSALNLDNRERFRIITDFRKQVGAFKTDSSGLTTGSPQNAYWSKYRKLNHETIYKGTGGTSADITTGALYLAYCVDTELTCSMEYYIRLRYVDP